MIGDLSFNALRKVNLDRVTAFGHGGIDDGWNEAEWGNAIAGEVGELCNVLKKFIRQAENDPDPDTLRTMAGKELADVVIYADLIAARLHVDLGDEVRAKFNEVSERHGFHQRL